MAELVLFGEDCGMVQCSLIVIVDLLDLIVSLQGAK